ncbi:hypothetical protein Tco_0703974 [Tanacetum coccineum]|uniref:Uncharacterized protein n=1 Tax=Tanacetum coccineum TaxID=301880 RepID=A0ABQ4Y2B3_9ASTR
MLLAVSIILTFSHVSDFESSKIEQGGIEVLLLWLQDSWRLNIGISFVVASDIVHQNICTSIIKQAMSATVRAGRAGPTNGQLEGEKYGHLQKAASILLSSADDPNRRTRSATLPFLRSFMYRNATGGPSIASIDGRVLALAACMLSVPYDMRSPLLQKQLQSSVGPMLILGAFRKIHLQKNNLRRAVNHYRLMDMKLGL